MKCRTPLGKLPRSSHGICKLDAWRTPTTLPSVRFERRMVVLVASVATPRLGIFLEVDKVLLDAHMKAHRVAFNKAFQELGQKAVSWSPELFWQLLRSAAATPDSLVQTYFNTENWKMYRVGWPTTVPRGQRQQLMESIQEKKTDILARMVDDGEIPLRPGVQQFLEDASEGGATIALLASTCSAPSERLVDAALTALGHRMSERMHVFQCPQGRNASSDPEASTADDPFSLERSLQAATAKRRQAEVQAFLETVNRSKLGADWREKAAASEPGQLAQRHMGEGMMIDPGLLVAVQRFSDLSPAWLAACCATLDVSLKRVALLSGTNSVLKAAQGSGIYSVAVPTALSGRGSFSGADVVMDSFGAGGGVTFRGLSRTINGDRTGRRKPRGQSH